MVKHPQERNFELPVIGHIEVRNGSVLVRVSDAGTERLAAQIAIQVAPELDSPDTARSLLKALFRSDASLRPDPVAETLTVRLLHLATRALDKALTPLLEELNRTSTVYPGTQLRMVYEVLPSDRPGRTVVLPRPTAPTPRVVPP